MNTASAPTRFKFDRNWRTFLRRDFSEERLELAKKRIVDFVGLSSLDGLDFLDIGCGSGSHSYAALRLGAKRVHGFDDDADSVEATRALQIVAERKRTS